MRSGINVAGGPFSPHDCTHCLTAHFFLLLNFLLQLRFIFTYTISITVDIQYQVSFRCMYSRVTRHLFKRSPVKSSTHPGTVHSYHDITH